MIMMTVTIIGEMGREWCESKETKDKIRTELLPSFFARTNDPVTARVSNTGRFEHLTTR
jgi:hypothetical protein